MLALPFTQINLTAGGNVNPARFIKQSAENTGILCAATTDRPIGISQGFSDRFPNDQTSTDYIAVSGRALPYHGPLQVCDLELGGTTTTTVAAGALLSTDSVGRGITATVSNSSTAVWVGAIALRGTTTALGEKVPVAVVQPFQYVA
jgi:hypothetical protein